jgi:hypothetical protein
MVRKKTRNHKTTRGLNEKKIEKSTTNMVMAIIIKSKVPKEVVFQNRKPFKGKEP